MHSLGRRPRQLRPAHAHGSAGGRCATGGINRKTLVVGPRLATLREDAGPGGGNRRRTGCIFFPLVGAVKPTGCQRHGATRLQGRPLPPVLTLSATPLLPLQSMAARAYVLLALALAVSEAQPPGCNQQCGSDADCNRTAVGACKAYTYCYHTHTIAGNLCFEQPKRYKCAGGGCVEQAGCTYYDAVLK